MLYPNTYYPQTESMPFSEAKELVEDYGYEFEDFTESLGIHDDYDSRDVLAWLGY